MLHEKNLIHKRCQPCEGKVAPFNQATAQNYLNRLPGWQFFDDAKGICRDYVMRNFLAGINFINEIAQIAEKENHHPDLHLTGYRKLRIELSTHAIGGLSENDFIIATKINALSPELKPEVNIPK